MVIALKISLFCDKKCPGCLEGDDNSLVISKIRTPFKMFVLTAGK